ncbi:MAG: hypothetical protein M3137_14225 [Actinomycetota bacterium]|nr:hypothetical protein [Actinomycetota bacterium]
MKVLVPDRDHRKKAIVFRHHHSDQPDPAFLDAHAEAEALYNRLGHDVSTLDDGGNPANRQAMVDAGERYNTAGAQLGQATTVGQLAVARSIVVEGLHATRLVRTQQGFDPGPDPALPVPAAQPTPVGQQDRPRGWGDQLPRRHGGLGGALGAGAAGGLLGGLIGGGMLGEILGGGDEEGGGGWGGDDDRGGGWEGGDGGGGGDDW